MGRAQSQGCDKGTNFDMRHVSNPLPNTTSHPVQTGEPVADGRADARRQRKETAWGIEGIDRSVLERRPSGTLIQNATSCCLDPRTNWHFLVIGWVKLKATADSS